LVVPDGSTRSILARDLYLLFPFGMAMVGLRFLLRAALGGERARERRPGRGARRHRDAA